MGGGTPHSKTTGRMTTVAEATSNSPPTSRHRRASESRESAAYLAAIVESADDAIISKTLDGIVISWNASAERMFGYSAQEMIGHPVLRLIPLDRHSEEDHILTRLRAGERIEHYETVRLRKDGRPLEVSLTISPVRDRSGAIIGASKIARDITERKRIEAALRAHEEEFRTITNATPALVWVCNAAGEGIHFNERWYEYTGLTADETLGYSWASVMHPEDTAWILPYWERCRATGETYEGEVRYRNREGVYRWHTFRALPRRGADGSSIEAWYGVSFDIHERRQLGQQTRWQASMLERAHDAIFMWELEGPILYWNHGAELLYGYSKEQAVGQISHQLLRTERPVSPAVFRKALRRDGEWIGNIQHTTRDGRHLAVESRHQLLVEADGHEYVLEACRDITDRLQLEQALRRSHDELEQRVRERTRDLASANRSLRRLSGQVLEAQETERRRIARELHDDIGQALTGVKLMLETAERKAETTGTTASERNYPVLEVRDAIDDALTRVRELSLDLRPAMLDSLGLLPTLLWRFETYTDQTDIQVEFHHKGLDQQRLAPEIETGAYRIVQEALTNVARYAGVPTVRIHINVTNEALHMYVMDEGMGFDADEAMATGLSTGLAGMRERATLLGGVFLVSSIPGAGTTIEVQLPRTTSYAPQIEGETEVIGA
jgi:PAS domain S-box-containing protein